VRSVFGSLGNYKSRLPELGKWIQRMIITAGIYNCALIYITVALPGSSVQYETI
jgi:hypothetical protein